MKCLTQIKQMQNGNAANKYRPSDFHGDFLRLGRNLNKHWDVIQYVSTPAWERKKSVGERAKDKREEALPPVNMLRQGSFENREFSGYVLL